MSQVALSPLAQKLPWRHDLCSEVKSMGSNHRALYWPWLSLGSLFIQHKAHSVSLKDPESGPWSWQSVWCRHEDLSSDPQNPCKKRGIVVHISDPSGLEEEMGGALRLTGQPVPMSGWAPGSTRNLTLSWSTDWGRHLMSTSGLSMLTNIQAPTDTSAHMHTQRATCLPCVPQACAGWVSPEYLRRTKIFSLEIIFCGSTDSRIFEERVPLFLIVGN